MATPYSGRTFYTSRGYRRLRRRMADFLRVFPKDCPVGTWYAVRAFLGDAALGLTPREARHKCQRLFRSAESEGFLARLPSRVESSAPTFRDEGRLLRKEIAWTITGEGLGFIRDIDLEMSE